MSYDESTNPSNGWRAPERVRLTAETAARNRRGYGILRQGGECARCGEQLDGEMAEVAVGVIHVGCMKPGEEIA